MIRKFGWVVLVALFGAASCDRSNESDLEIERKSHVLNSKNSYEDIIGKWEELENGLVKARFVVPPTVVSTSGGSAAADPFAAPEEGQSIPRLAPKEVFENAGVSFEKGALALYDRDTEILTVIQARDQMELVEAFLDSCLICGHSHFLYMRAEVYELPVPLGLDAVESASSEIDHSPERDAIVAALKPDSIRLVTSLGITCRSGQRAIVESALPLPDSTEKKKSKGESGGEEESDVPSANSQPIFAFELDPVLGADEETLDVNFRFALADGDDPTHSNGIQTVTSIVTLTDGEWLLAANWIVPGTARMRLLFLIGTVQHSDLHPQILTGSESRKAE